MGHIVIDGYCYDSDMIIKLPKAFVKSDKTDAILVVQGNKLHVNKAILSYHSDYFKTLFNSEIKEKSMEEIEIKDVKYVGDVRYMEFAMLLSLVHDSPVKITHANAECLLKLADRFLLRGPKQQLEYFIISSADFNRHRKLVLADKYNSENLLKHAMGLYDDKAAYQDFFCSENRKFSKNLKLRMFDDFFAKFEKMVVIIIDYKEYDKTMVEKLEKAFAKSDRTDAILVAGGKKLHVNKALLSYHSDYFNTLFNSEFKEKSMEEIPIEDVKFEDFATLLSLVHEKPCEIIRCKAENLLKLADRFLLNNAKVHIEFFIKSSNGFTRYQKLKIADDYKLEYLLEHALGLIHHKMSFLVYIDDEPYDCDVVEKLEKAFAKSDRTDAILVIQGKKLHVNKALLSYHSDYFNTLFNSDFKEKSMEEIELKDVKYVHFARLLSLVHETPVAITEYNAEKLLELADRFLLRGPKIQLEHFMISSQYFNRHEKLVLADKYNLENLLEHAIELYNNKESYRDFYSSESRTISDKLRLKMFDEYFAKYGDSI
ncbi:unnamed protein product [Caenorhabditis brenneri]